MSDVWLNIVMVVVFVLIGGAFSGAEIALVSLSQMIPSGRFGFPASSITSTHEDPEYRICGLSLLCHTFR